MTTVAVEVNTQEEKKTTTRIRDRKRKYNDSVILKDAYPSMHSEIDIIKSVESGINREDLSILQIDSHIVLYWSVYNYNTKMTDSFSLYVAERVKQCSRLFRYKCPLQFTSVDFEECEKRNINIENISHGQVVKIPFKCKEHTACQERTWEQTPNDASRVWIKCQYCDGAKKCSCENLEALFPTIFSEINFKKSLEIYPNLDNISIDSNKNLIWTCTRCRCDFRCMVMNRTDFSQACPGCQHCPNFAKKLNHYENINDFSIQQLRALTRVLKVCSRHSQEHTISRRVRGRDMDDSQIDMKFLMSLFIQQNGQCYHSSIKMNFCPGSENWTLSLERLNPNIGYVLHNVALIVAELNCSRTWNVEKFLRMLDILDLPLTELDLSEIKLDLDKYKPLGRNVEYDSNGNIAKIGCSKCNQCLDVSQFTRKNERKIPYKSSCKNCDKNPSGIHQQTENSTKRKNYISVFIHHCSRAKSRFDSIHKQRQRSEFEKWTLKCQSKPTKECSDFSSVLAELIHNFWDLMISTVDTPENRNEIFEKIWKSHLEKIDQNFITVEYLIQLYFAQKGRCKISTIPMSLEHNSDWLLSVERVDNFQTYTKENIKLICFEFNTAAQWTEEKFEVLESATRKKYNRPRIQDDVSMECD